MEKWISGEYYIEGPDKDITSIQDLIKSCIKGYTPPSMNDLRIILNDDFEEYPNLNGYIENSELEPCLDGIKLHIWTSELSRLSDFGKLLKNNFHSIRIYYYLEDITEGIYLTNDINGEYFDEEVVLNYNDDFDSEVLRFLTKEDALEYLGPILHIDKVNDEKLAKWNREHDDDYALIYNIKRVKDELTV